MGKCDFYRFDICIITLVCDWERIVALWLPVFRHAAIAVDDLYLLMRLCIQVINMRTVAVTATIAVGSEYEMSLC